MADYVSAVIDTKEIRLKFGKFADRITDLRPFWIEYFAPQLYSDIQRNFQSEGQPVGGWRALSPRYAAWKRRHYGRKPILVRTSAMKESFRKGGRGSIMNVKKLSAEFGSRIRHWRYHQKGTDRMPQRKIVFIGGVRVYQALFREYLNSLAFETGIARRR